MNQSASEPYSQNRALAKSYANRLSTYHAQLQASGYQPSGSIAGSVLFLKSQLNQAEKDGAELLSQADGQALKSALAALGYAPDCWTALNASADSHETTLRQAIEMVDPEIIVILDEQSGAAFIEAFDLTTPLMLGEVTRILGRRILPLMGFEDALTSDDAKQRMWAYLKRVPELGAPY